MYNVLQLPKDLPVSPTRRYIVTLATPKGMYDVELQSYLGPQAACRRAHLSLVGVGFGDMATVLIESCVPWTEDQWASRTARPSTFATKEG